MKLAAFMFRFICGAILVVAILQLTSRAHAEDGKAVSGSSAVTKTPERAEPPRNDAAIAEDLENKRMRLEQRSRDLDDEQARIVQREKDLDQKLAEMQRLRQAVSGELDAQKKNNEDRIVKLVAVFENMNPKSAAAVLETLDDWLSVEVLKRMDVKRVAKVMNQMDKNRSAKLSELMTGFYRPDEQAQEGRSLSSVAGQAQASQAVAPKPKQSIQKKGGEK